MTFFSTPMARQFVGFDTLFEELNALSDRKEPNYPAYNIAKDDDEHYRRSRLQASHKTTLASRLKKAY